MPVYTRLHQLADHGQSVRIDFLSRELLESGALARAVERDAVGVDYEDVVTTLEREGIEKFVASYERLLERIATKLALPVAPSMRTSLVLMVASSVVSLSGRPWRFDRRVAPVGLLSPRP